MNLSRAWFLYISPFSLYLTPPHTLLLQYVSLCEGEDGKSRSVLSRNKDARRRTGSSWAPALKTNCDKDSVCNESIEIGPGMLDYLLHLAPTYRERILTSEKSKTGVNTFFLPSLSFVGFHGGFGILPLLLWCWIVAFWSFFGGIVARMEDYQWWGGMTYKLIRFVALCWVCCSFQWCSRLSDDPWIFFFIQADTTIVVVFPSKD